MNEVAKTLNDDLEVAGNLVGSEDLYRIMFEFAPDAYYLNDLDARFIDGNKQAERLIGYGRAELIGKSFLELDLLSPEQLPKAAAALAENALSQSTGRMDLS